MSIPHPFDSESQWVMRAVQSQRFDPTIKYPLPEGITIEKATSLRKRADCILEEFQGKGIVDVFAELFKKGSTKKYDSNNLK